MIFWSFVVLALDDVSTKEKERESERESRRAGSRTVTRWLDYLANIWPFTTMNIRPKHLQFNKVSSIFFQVLYESFQNVKSFFYIMPKWRNFAKSGHTTSHGRYAKISLFDVPSKPVLMLMGGLPPSPSLTLLQLLNMGNAKVISLSLSLSRSFPSSLCYFYSGKKVKK